MLLERQAVGDRLFFVCAAHLSGRTDDNMSQFSTKKHKERIVRLEGSVI